MSGFREAVDPNWAVNLPRQPADFLYGRTTAPDYSIAAVDRILEPQTIARFLEFANTGTLPTGEKTTFPLMTAEVFKKYMTKPYSQWSPGPHDKFGVSPIDHAFVRIGSDLDSSRLTIVEKGVVAMKTRLWEGMALLSERRWREKHLDDPAYHHLACRIIGQVIEVFSYLQDPLVLNMLTETYVLIHEHFRDFDNAVNALSERQEKPRVNIAGLWEAFMTAHYTVMTTRAHSWVLAKAASLRDRDQELMRRAETTAGEALEIGHRIQDLSELTLRADFTIFIHMPTCDPPVQHLVPPLAVRRLQSGQTVRQLSRQYIMEDTLRHVGMNTQSPWTLSDNAQVQREAQNRVRLELRGELRELPAVGWVSSLKEKTKSSKYEGKAAGFVAYRLTYGQSEEEWAGFVRKLEADINDWGEGELGVKDIKPKMRLEWIDGKESGIMENDIEGARKHFNKLAHDAKGVPMGMTQGVFLAIGSDSYDSYTYGSPFANLLFPGDTKGFVTAVQAEHDPENTGGHAEESPFFPGHLRILGSLVYSDLYAMLAAETQDPRDLWPLAMDHPELIYTGPMAKGQVDLWKKATVTKLKLFEMFQEEIKKSELLKTSG